MKGFRGNLTIRRVSDRDYKVIGYISYTNNDFIIKVTEGFVTDGASMPKFAWRIIGSPFTGKYVESAVIHDSLYRTHKLTKETADKLFLEMMKVSGVRWWKRKLMYYAVKWFGYSSYNGYSNKELNKNSKYVEVIKL